MMELKGADFEEAVAATKFGPYNLLLILIALPSTLATQVETTALAFVIPAAHCDLHLTLQDKGALNAMVYAGMLTSGLFVGLIADVVGRRRALIFTYFLDAILTFILAFSSNTYIMLIAKFFGGFIINGASAALPAYIAEFHGKTYRSKIQLVIGILYVTGNILLSLVAWAILSMEYNFMLFDTFEIHAWNLFLLACCLPTLLAGIFCYLMPESPKFLMTEGHNEQALEIFHKVYRWNTGKPKNSYPINKLLIEKQSDTDNTKKSLKTVWKQMTPLFSKRYLVKLILVCIIMFCIMLSMNTLRLWLPQMFQTISDYENSNNKTNDFCTMLEGLSNSIDEDFKNCTVNLNNSSVYINSGIISAVTIVLYLTTASLINKIGKKTILGSLNFIGGIFALSIYFAPTNLLAVIFICINIGCSCICVDVLIAVIIDLFPTTLRASALSLALVLGRLGSLIGNLTIPYLLQMGCGPPFFSLATISIGCSIMTLFLPSTHLKSLE